MLTEVIVILVLIVLNGVLSASEIAIVSSRKARLQAEATTSNGAKKALQLKENPNQFFSTVQIGITLIGIMTGYFSGGTMSSYLQEALRTIPIVAPYSGIISTGVVVLVITFLSLIIGELVPKRIGMAIPERYASLIAIPMSAISVAVRPFVWILSASTDFIVRLLNIKAPKNNVTEEEIKALVDEGVDSGVIEGFEHDMVDRLLDVGDKRAINLMVHRSDIFYLDINAPTTEIQADIIKFNHNEYPVCDGTFDHIKGIIDAKVLLKTFLQHEDIDLAKLVQPIPFVDENSSVYSVLEILRNSSNLQAVVVDEYGTPQGIITAKGIVSAMVGGFAEHDSISNAKAFRQREDGSFIIEGRFKLTDFWTRFNLDISEKEEEEFSNITTVAGLLFVLLDHMPTEGDSIPYKGLRLEVIDMDGNRIDKIAVENIA